MRGLILTLAGLVLLGGPAAAADPAAGRALAERWCATCHLVGPQASTGRSDVPTFSDIARRPGGAPAEWLAFRLLAPHPQMPSVSLSRTEAQDLSAYLASLKN